MMLLNHFNGKHAMYTTSTVKHTHTRFCLMMKFKCSVSERAAGYQVTSCSNETLINMFTYIWPSVTEKDGEDAQQPSLLLSCNPPLGVSNVTRWARLKFRFNQTEFSSLRNAVFVSIHYLSKNSHQPVVCTALISVHICVYLFILRKMCIHQIHQI